MTKPKLAKLKIAPPLGRMPVLQFLPPQELDVDSKYQRSAAGADSQVLIRRIAQNWNWDLCLPLAVARRQTESGERYFVIDGQHRLEAARLRGDIPQLPCVVLTYADVAAEAASFVKLNQDRKPLKKLDLFKAAIASGDPEATAILEAMTDAGLSVAPHGNPTAWKPGMVSNISGIENVWRKRGRKVAAAAMRALAQAYAGQVLQLAGTIFPGIAAVCFDEFNCNGSFVGARLDKFVTMLAIRSQDDWRREINSVRVSIPNLNLSGASEHTLREAWSRSSAEAAGRPKTEPAPAPAPARQAAPRAATAPAPKFTGSRWCEQCDQLVGQARASACSDRFCKLKAAA